MNIEFQVEIIWLDLCRTEVFSTWNVSVSTSTLEIYMANT